MLKKILVGIDFSVASASALDFATRLAAAVSAKVVIGHAYTPTEYTEEEIAALAGQVEAFLPDSLREQTRSVLHPGSPGEVMCWIAQQEACDMIVLGSHGHSGLLHRLLGGTAEYVVAHARVPVLVVPARTIHEKPLPEPLIVPLPAPRFM